MRSRLFFFTATALAAFCLDAPAALQTYPGVANGATTTPFVSGGTLQLSGNVGSSISFTFTRGGGDGESMSSEYLVLFLDSRAGGYGSTASFTDRGTGGRSSISGLNWANSSRHTATFVNGFTADYAIIINPNVGAQLWQLGLGQFPAPQSLLAGGLDGRNRTYSFTVPREALGIGAADSLFFQSALVTDFGSRSSRQSFEVVTGTLFFGQTYFQNFNVFEVQPVPEMTNLALVIFGGVFVGWRFVPRVRRFLDGGRHPRT